MARRYLFADEAGDFNFSRGPNVSRYFIICTVTMNDCAVGDALSKLRRELVWKAHPVRDYFHATEDRQVVRDAVFETICQHDFRVQATIMEKSKAQPQVRETKHRFYQYGWLYHFRHGVVRHLPPEDELLVTTASIGTKKGQGVFTTAVEDVVGQHIPRNRWKTFFCQSGTDHCLQVADYCTWAIQRLWERGDTRAYDLIKDRVTYEYDLWRRGDTHHY